MLRRKSARTLVVCSLLCTSLSCGEPPPPHSRPTHPKQAPQAKVLFTPPEDGPCGRFSTFDAGEKVQQIIHGQDVDYTLTDRTLYIWRFVSEAQSADGKQVTVQHNCSRSDVRGILQQGVLLWHLEGDICYFFTKNQQLIALPHGDMRQMLTYKLDFETDTLNAKRIAFFGGMIFFAPISDRVIVMSLEPELKVIPLEVDIARNPKAEFIAGNDVKGNDRLYFGVKEGVLFEIFIAGPTASYVNALELR